MEKLIKHIRNYLGLSQEELADKLHISFAAVNRWENGRAIPNKIAQSALYELCNEFQVPVYEFILQKIQDAVNSIENKDNKVVLFHGSKSGISGDIAPISRKECDFGPGFYMGTDPSQSLTLICDYEESKFYIVSIDMDGLTELDIPTGIEWAMIVAYHRGKMETIKNTDFYEKYRNRTKDKDLIIGNIANDRMFFVMDNFFMGNITDAALVNSLSALQLGKQYVAVSEKACKAIKIETEVGLSFLERMFIRNISEQNRARGISLANSICKDHRREGLFFDEILENAQKGLME